MLIVSALYTCVHCWLHFYTLVLVFSCTRSDFAILKTHKNFTIAYTLTIFTTKIFDSIKFNLIKLHEI